MAFEVEVLKIDYSEMEVPSVLTCKMETKESGEKIYRSVEILRGEKLVLKFAPAAPTSHKTTLEFQIASSKSGNPCRCLNPLNLSNASTELSGKEFSSDSHVRLIHFSTPLADTNMEQVKCTMWFRVKIYQAKSATQLDSNLKGICLKEQQSSCSYSQALRAAHPTVFVLFNTVSVEKRLTGAKITPIAHVNETPVENSTSILNKTGEEIGVVPIFKTVALKCQSKNQVIQLHLVSESDPEPQFSAAIPLQDLQPFKSYNWKFDQKWSRTSCQPPECKLNDDTYMTSSLMYFPPSSDYSSYEGLEIFVEIPVLERSTRDNLIVTLQLENKKPAASDAPSDAATATAAQAESSSSTEGGDTGDDETDNETISAAVMQSWGEGGFFLSSPAYFFVPSSQKIYEGYKAHLRFYSFPQKDSKPWWDSDSRSSVVVYFTSDLMNDLLSPGNEHGLKLKFMKDGIEHSSQNSALFQQINAVVRWKTKDKNFLSEMLSIPEPASATNSTQVQPSATNSTQVQPSATNSTQVQPSATNSTQVQPSATNSTQVQPSATNSTQVQPSATNSTQVQPSAKDPSSAATKSNCQTVDVEKLQNENDLLKNENKAFEKYITDMEASIISTATERSQLQVLTKFDLIQNMIRLSDLLLKEKEVRIKLQAKIKKLQEVLTKYKQTESDFLELQRAHVSQQSLLRQLQEKIMKYKKSIHICKQQDLTITNLEKALCEKSIDVKMKETMAELKRENAYLRSMVPINPDRDGNLLAEKEKTIATLQKEVSQLSDRMRNLKQIGQHSIALEGLSHRGTTYQREKDRYEDLKQQLVIAEIRERVAVKELLASRDLKNGKSKQLRMPHISDREMLLHQGDGRFHPHASHDDLRHWPREARPYRHGISHPYRSYVPNPSPCSSRSSLLPEPLPPLRHNRGFYTPSSSSLRHKDLYH